MKFPRHFDWLLFISTILLCLIGLSLIYSVFSPYERQYGVKIDYSYFNKQVRWFCFGFLAMLIGCMVPIRYFEALAFVFYFACILSLLAVYMFGVGTQAQRWLPLGPLKVQPSEFTKIALLFVWARVLSGQREDRNRKRNLFLTGFLFAVPFLLVLKEPDLGTAIIFLALLLPVLYWRGLKGLHILFILSPFISGILILYGKEILSDPYRSLPFGAYIVAIFVVAYLRRSNLLESVFLIVANLGAALAVSSVFPRLASYQQDRILSFLAPGAHKLKAGWQVIQSKIAIGSGGIMGKGYLDGKQKSLEFLPAKHTDFIFSVLGEEMGFIGAIAVLILFFVIIYSALAIAAKAKSEFTSSVCVGIAAYFFFQVFINVAMVIGIAPVTGIPLPFLSYGGSSMLVSCFLVGFLLNAGMKWFEY